MPLEKLIKLDIAMDYPVHWDFAKILRDLIQNFYDAATPALFGTQFQYRYYEEDDSLTLCMQTAHTPFVFDWLVYFGGSTKTGRHGYIGKYGEGFKICMLCLWNLGIHDIRMHSASWQLSPCEYLEQIEGRPIRMLGYKYCVVPDDDLTTLTIRGIPEQNSTILQEGPLHFFYKGNPLFGEELISTAGYSVFSASGKAVPCRQFPKPKGILYLNHLARGRLDVPLFIDLCGDLERSTTRERRVLEPDQVWELLYSLCVAMTPEDSLVLLLKLKPHWSETNENPFDVRSWFYIICQLVRNVSTMGPDQYTDFLGIQDLAYIGSFGSFGSANSSGMYGNSGNSAGSGNSVSSGNNASSANKPSGRAARQQIRQVRAWAQDNSHKRIVNPIFRLLGAENLTVRYEREMEQNLRKPSEEEMKKILLILRTLRQILPDPAVHNSFVPDPAMHDSVLPDLNAPDSAEPSSLEVWIGSARQAEQEPHMVPLSNGKEKTTSRTTSTTPSVNHSYYKPRYSLNRIILCAEDFLPGAFDHTLVRTADKLLHIYGSSKSERLNDIFTDFGAWLIQHADLLETARREWIADDKGPGPMTCFDL